MTGPAAAVLFALSLALVIPATPAAALPGASDAAIAAAADADAASVATATAASAIATANGEPPTAATAPAEPPAAPADAVAPAAPHDAGVQYVAPSIGAAAFRLFLGLAGVGLAMAGCVGAYRFILGRRPGAARAGLERRLRPQVVSRTYLGAKESLCVVEVANERFLIATTPTRISLLGRLERGESPAAEAPEPRAADFARVLKTAASMGAIIQPPTAPAVDESEMLAALARSRDRLARLVGVSAGEDRRA